MLLLIILKNIFMNVEEIVDLVLETFKNNDTVWYTELNQS